MSRNVNSLPNELLCEVFFTTISPHSAQTDRCRLILVCRRWKEYVEASPLLWADISARSGRAYMRRALENSKNSKIDLHYPAYSESHIDLESFLAEAVPHIARWRSLTLLVRWLPESWERKLGPFTTAQAPRLESLHLSLFGRGHPGYRNQITLFNGTPAPSSLKHLTLYRVPVAFEPLNLSSLVSLDLSTIPNISTPQLLEILRNSPGLEILSLDHTSGLVGIGSQLPTIPPITLPKLTSLNLEVIDRGGANCILSMIRIPNRRRLYIYDEISETSDQSVLLTPTTAHILHTTITAPDPRFSTINVEVDDSDNVLIQFRGMKLELCGAMEEQIEGVLHWLAEGLGSEAAACPVRLKVTYTDMDPLRLVAVPSPLVVKQLSIDGSLLLSLLQSPRVAIFQPSPPTPSGWLLAEVESLAVGFDTIEDQDQFVAMLKVRHAEVASSIQIEPKGPMSLTSIELQGRPRDNGLVEDLVEILGEVKVFWND